MESQICQTTCGSHLFVFSNVSDSLSQIVVNPAARGSSEYISHSAVNNVGLEDASSDIQALLEVINVHNTIIATLSPTLLGFVGR